MRWRHAPLATVAPAEPSSIQFVPDEQVWHLTLDQIEADSGRTLNPRIAPACEAGTSTFAFDDGNVLYSKLRPYLNKVVRPRSAGIATTELVPMRPRPGVLQPDFLAYYLRAPHFVAFASSCTAGTKMPRVMMSKVWEHEIPLPPLSEQRRIVEILDQADRLRRLRAEADANADRILPALFIKMFGDPATNPMCWEEDTIGNIAETISDGPFGSNLKTSHYVREGVRVVRLQNIGIGKFLDTDRAFVSHEHFGQLSKHRCLPGDVLVGTLGDPNLRACMLPATVPEALNKADCVHIRAREGRATNEYICWLLNMPSTLLLAQELIHGQTRTRVSMGRLRDLRVPLPPLELQQRFIKHVVSGGQLDSRREQRRNATDRLCHLLHQRAFTGDLTAGWREGHMNDLPQEMEHQAKALAEVP